MDTGTYTNPRPGQYLMLEHSHIAAREERTKQKKKRLMSSAGCLSLHCIFQRSNNIEATPRLASFIGLIRSLVPSFFPTPHLQMRVTNQGFLALEFGDKSRAANLTLTLRQPAVVRVSILSLTSSYMFRYRAGVPDGRTLLITLQMNDVIATYVNFRIMLQNTVAPF